MTDQLQIPEWNTRAAVAFLKQRGFFPVLSCVDIDQRTGKKGAFVTKSFPQGADGAVPWDSVYEWIETRQGRGNLYYSVNPTLRPVDKKLERTDIRGLASLHVDLDPRVGEDQDDAQARIVKQLDGLKRPPTWIISSGGGVQGIWDLTEEVPIGGNLDVAEDVKMFNIQIERELGGDHCHNIDRIMRLPGTVNCPDERKRSKGRRYATAKIIKRNDTHYTIADFVKAAPLQDQKSNGTSAGGNDIKISIPTNINQILNLDDDEHCKKLKGWVKHTLVWGHDLEGGHVWASRSEMVFAVVCELKRSEVPDDKIVALMLDRDYKWSASILEKKNVDREVKRLLSRAAEKAIDQDLFEMNGKFAIVILNNKVRVMYWRPSPSGNGELEPRYMTIDDFRNFMQKYRKEIIIKDPETGEIKTKLVPMGDWWLSHPNRKQFIDVIYAPHIDVEVVGEGSEAQLNLWRGFTVSAIPGDKHKGYLAHLHDNICDGNDEHFKYLIGWMADRVQHRGRPAGVAVVIKSEEEGTGKSFFATNFGYLFGKHFQHITNAKHLIGNFNDHLRDCSVLFSDEAFYAKDKQHAGILKTLITEQTMTIERKGVDAAQARNFMGLIIGSNHDFTVPAGLKARRFFVLQVAIHRLQDSVYFGAIKEELEAGGYENLLHFLMTYDLSGFDIRAVPQTAALAQQKAFTRQGIDAMVEMLADDGVLPCQHGTKNDVALTSGDKRGEGLWSWARDNFKELQFLAPRTMLAILEKNWACTKHASNGFVGVRFPPLTELRRLFDERHGAQKWSETSPNWDRRTFTAETTPRAQDDIPF